MDTEPRTQRLWPLVTILLIVISAYTTVWFVSALSPISTGALVCFLVWLILPYGVMSGALIFFHHQGIYSNYPYAVVIIVAIGGPLFLADVIFWHPDAQGALAVLMTPILQIAALIFLLPVTWWLSRNTRT